MVEGIICGIPVQISGIQQESVTQTVMDEDKGALHRRTEILGFGTTIKVVLSSQLAQAMNEAMSKGEHTFLVRCRQFPIMDGKRVYCGTSVPLSHSITFVFVDLLPLIATSTR